MINQMVEMYNKINWIFVYISEAHAIDEWPVQSPRCTYNNEPIIIKQSYNLESRIALANDFAEHYEFLPSMYVSPPEFIINFELYKPWPFRIYGFNGYNITFASEPRECETHLEEVVAWIEK